VSNLRFVTLAPDYAELIEDWFDDADTVRFVGGLDWLASTLRFERPADSQPVDGDEPVAHHAWLALAGEQPVALVDVLSYRDGSASMKMTVAPTRRKLGLGKAVLHAVWRLPEMKDITEVFGYVDTRHHAAVRLAESSGFVATGAAKADGEVLFRRRRPADA
jgi:GNAT superfamily N-acetyltransferase